MQEKIAVSYENGEVFQHFGHTKEFKLYTVEDGGVLAEEIVPTMGGGHGLLADFLLLNGVNVVICGGIGGGARAALTEKGIALRGGVTGSADEAVRAYLAGTLQFDAEVRCGHHAHGNGHSCGEHCH